GLRRSSMPRVEVSQRVADALEWAGLSHLAARNARQLSGGEKQRVALARARVLSPRLLLLDEPVASMDYESRERTYVLIQRLRSEGMAVIVTSHELQRLASLGNLHLHLHAGALLWDFDYPGHGVGAADETAGATLLRDDSRLTVMQTETKR
ncbi:MAG: ATP-binding cassette domain-containing protein, partial [Acidiferrobacterales bacterium]